MDFIKNLKILFFTIIVILWSDVFNAGSYSSQTSDTSIADDGSRLTESRELLHPTPTKKPTRKPTRKPKTLRPLPQKDETFLDIRVGKKVFVDKTPYITELLKDRRRCILFTRPRRFGKSNFLQMLHSFFSGQKELFKGTKIYSRGNTDKKGEWVEYPVVNLTFSRIAKYGKKVPSAELFETRLYDTLQDIADFYKVDCDENLDTLVKNLRKKFCLPVVILIDEYDYPFTSILHKRPDGSLTTEETNMLQGMKTTLEQFFGTIKDLIEANEVRLAFVTGVARLAFEGLPGSGPNNVVTLTDKYSCMVGFTIDEISRYLGPHIDQFAKVKGTSPEEITQKLLNMYGGYIFSDTRKTEVLNPVSLLACLTEGKFNNYWCPTHSLDIVLDKMSADKVTPDHFAGFKEPVASLYERNPTHNEIPTSVYLLVYGYLTIKEYDTKTEWVKLDYPNDEIKDVLVNNFKIRLMLDHPAQLGKDQSNIFRYLELKQVQPLVKVLNKLGFRNQAPAEYQLQLGHEFNSTTILYLIFRTMGLNTRIGMKMLNLPGKDPLGDLDLVIMTESTTYVIEAKYEQDDELKGMKQLLGYITKNEEAVLKYIAETRRQRKLQETDQIYLLGLNFKKDPSGSTQSVKTFIALPWEPSNCGEKDGMKLWFNRMEGNGDMESIHGELKEKYERVLLDRAVW